MADYQIEGLYINTDTIDWADTHQLSDVCIEGKPIQTSYKRANYATLGNYVSYGNLANASYQLDGLYVVAPLEYTPSYTGSASITVDAEISARATLRWNSVMSVSQKPTTTARGQWSVLNPTYHYAHATISVVATVSVEGRQKHLGNTAIQLIPSVSGEATFDPPLYSGSAAINIYPKVSTRGHFLLFHPGNIRITYSKPIVEISAMFIEPSARTFRYYLYT